MLKMELINETRACVRLLQAEQIAQSRVLRALIASHPNPALFRAEWQGYSAASAAKTSLEKAMNPEQSDWHQELLQQLADWNRYVEECLARRETPPD